jgi:hypothetical protein
MRFEDLTAVDTMITSLSESLVHAYQHFGKKFPTVLVAEECR